MVGGRLLGGRYLLEERIAAGGMGTVYGATDQRLQRRVAVKLLKEDLAQDERFVARFEREARAAAALSHPNVASVFDYGEDEATRFIVMELAPGRDLARVLREDGRLPPERARAIGVQICAALAHAHSAGLVHRDVKPANVIVDESGGVKVTDFGIARASGETTLTATGSVLGSAQYMAPEQASGAPVTPATDVYSAGIVLYEMLTNAVPFTGDSPVSVAMRHVSDEVPAPSSVVPGVPESLDRIVSRATAKDPARRWPDAAAMGAALEGGDTVEVAPAAATAPTTVWPIPGDRYDPRRLGTRVLVLAAVLAVGAAAVWAWLLTRPDEEPARAADRRDERVEPLATPEPDSASQAYELPDLTGMPFKEAEKELEEHGLVVVPREQPADVEKDEVLGMEPEPGTAVSPGATVTLIVSTGKVEEEPDEDDDDSEGGEGPGNSENAPGHTKDEKEDE
ncbi:MAG: protein kinase [Actinomycetota bacterium]|nr:protein kinase [Actinomycetota bacterium]